MITYESKNGYKGVLCGPKSFSIYDKDGREVFHTGSRNIDTYKELKREVDRFPKFLEMLTKM